jgi:hypothetical protein
MITLEEVRARFARDQGLPFADSLSELSILDALNEHGIKYRDRVFTPVTTIWGFLSQVLSEDHSCRDAVSRIIAHRKRYRRDHTAAADVRVAVARRCGRSRCSVRQLLPRLDRMSWNKPNERPLDHVPLGLMSWFHQNTD